MKKNDKVVIIGTDLNFGRHVVAEPKPGTHGTFQGQSPIPGKVSIKFKGKALGYSDNAPVIIYMDDSLVAPEGTTIENVLIIPKLDEVEPEMIEFIGIEEEISAELSAELKEIWAEVFASIESKK